MICAVALSLIILHRADGGEVIINPAQVTSLRATAGSLGRLAPHGHCLVGLTDGKFVAVIEPCGDVKKLLEGGPAR
ncbi:MAG TPA: hypothetical protein VJ890_21180 [Vineibacter sp.]|nr:hypothetical protein [Vineibacter sp.]